MLYQDAAHAYDDENVILLSRKRVPSLQSELIPVKKGDNFLLEVNAHYTKGNTGQVLKRIGTTAAGVVIATLPRVLSSRQDTEEGLSKPLEKGLIAVGTGLALSPLVVNKIQQHRLNKQLFSPNIHNGLNIPDAYLRYNLYNKEGLLIESEHRAINKEAKDAWQKLYLRKEIEEDGYMDIDLVNTSKQPVWLDGFKLSYTSQEAVIAGIKSQLKKEGVDTEKNSKRAVPVNPGTGITNMTQEDCEPWDYPCVWAPEWDPCVDEP